MQNKNQYLTAKEISKILRIPQRTVYHLTKTGKIKAVKIGKSWRYFKEDIKRHFLYSEIQFPERDSDNERRQFPRMNTNLDCNYSVNLKPFKKVNGAGIIKNLCAGGILLVVKNGLSGEIEINDPVNLSFTLDNGTIAACKGKVIRKGKETYFLNGKDIADGRGIGIRFRGLPYDTRAILETYCR